MKITLVEDDQTMRGLLKTLLELEGYHVSICVERKEPDIVQNILDDLPDVVILDVHLADADGISVVKNLKQHPELSVKVIMTSGLPLKNECLDAGADHFLEKPFMPDDLIMSI